MANTYNQEFNHYHIIGIICLLPFVTLIHPFCHLLHYCHPLFVILFLHFVTCCPSLPSATCCIPSLLTSIKFHHFSLPPHSITSHVTSVSLCLWLPVAHFLSLDSTNPIFSLTIFSKPWFTISWILFSKNWFFKKEGFPISANFLGPTSHLSPRNFDIFTSACRRQITIHSVQLLLFAQIETNTSRADTLAFTDSTNQFAKLPQTSHIC